MFAYYKRLYPIPTDSSLLHILRKRRPAVFPIRYGDGAHLLETELIFHAYAKPFKPIKHGNVQRRDAVAPALEIGQIRIVGYVQRGDFIVGRQQSLQLCILGKIQGCKMVEAAVERNQTGVSGDVQGGEIVLTAIQELEIEEILQSSQGGDALFLEIHTFNDRRFLHRHFPILVRIEIRAAIGRERAVVHPGADIVHLLEGIFRAGGQDGKRKKREVNRAFHFL